MNLPVPCRKIVVEQLEMLASETEQLKYEKNVPSVDVTAELISGWFDDSYHPDDAHFRSCFTDAELAALAEFDALFEERRRLLPESKGSVKSWLASPAWREVMNAASRTLASLAV